ncbi:helix-turn-helix domain-containing protein [Cellvibrio japonicus]|uniref:Transcriptional regulator, AraC family n=1 Tax=Cellvibrio japonicus (strain Ueda107) TaxID=498211 RepID=B3PGH4_CELJU|nr:helix-turn-helix domain-containing protein [Cellvibrio japonicus]ACE83626.1 transcriptional regulator, AraC family [Cellvibrio japonicus Ueda107]QEI10961.1 AraC family transcriptional regulator [Cellvibrio japonicus]QEI14537.1 AraC family transcriptional regulator [Cellvibrio japonicus]QEI18115.1 AraC family transcriptional regulator [Cellvibrio japonicus]
MQKHIFNIHDVVLFMTMAECLLLVIFQAMLPVKNKLANRLLSAFMLSIAVGSACVLVLWNDDVKITPVFDDWLLPYCLSAAQLLKGPILLLYVASLTEDSFRLRRDHLLHLIPLALTWAWLAILSIDSSDLRFRTLGQTPEERELANAVWHFIKLLPLAYGIAAVLRVHSYRRSLKNQYSHFSPLEPSWLNILSLGFLVTWSFSILVHLIANTIAANYPNISDAFGITENYLILILINALFINSLVHTHELLTTKPEPPKEKTEEKLSDSAIAKVQQGMEEQKLFLKQNLNIEEFAKRISLSVKDVSAVINKHYGTNFFEFMNSYRVEEAKRLLGDQAYADMTVMDVLLQAGFNSKSAFHRFFNRLVGISPTEYRKQHLGKEEKVA